MNYKIGKLQELTKGFICSSCSCSCTRIWACFNFFHEGATDQPILGQTTVRETSSQGVSGAAEPGYRCTSTASSTVQLVAGPKGGNSYGARSPWLDRGGEGMEWAEGSEYPSGQLPGSAMSVLLGSQSS